MSKARIRRVRTERDTLAAELATATAELESALSDLQTVRDVVGWYDPAKQDPTEFRNALWEVVRPPWLIV
jgi:hypothetical protein